MKSIAACIRVFGIDMRFFKWRVNLQGFLPSYHFLIQTPQFDRRLDLGEDCYLTYVFGDGTPVRHLTQHTLKKKLEVYFEEWDLYFNSISARRENEVDFAVGCILRSASHPTEEELWTYSSRSQPTMRSTKPHRK